MNDINFSKRLFPSHKRSTKKQRQTITKDVNVLYDAYYAWESLRDFREEAKRNAMYTFGNQWGDYVVVNGKKMREEDYIKSQGKVPLKNNRVRSLVRSVLGQFSTNQTEPVCVARDRDEQGLGEMMSATVQYAYQRNRLWELDRRNLESFLVTGAAFFRTYYGWKDEPCMMDAWVDSVNYNKMFFDKYMDDPRHWDCTLIGQIHDLNVDDVIAQFATPENEDQIRDIYRSNTKEGIMTNVENLTQRKLTEIDFFVPDDFNRCRVIEMWRKETKRRIRVHDWLTGEYYKVELNRKAELDATNEVRRQEQAAMGVAEEDMKLLEYQIFTDRYWYFRFMSPYGDILKQGETPYWHKSHPYSFKIYPFFNSEVHSFVSDFVDQQRYINRLITTQDFIMSAAAKGLLMFPEESLPEGMSMEEIADEWSAYNGIIYYKAKAGIPAPQQIVSNTSNSGVYDMLNVQLKLLEDISGVSGALQGQGARSGTSGALYAQQTQNSAINLVDVMESFRQLREDRDLKLLKTQQQFYTDVRYLNIAGSNYSRQASVYDPKKGRNVEVDLSLTESTSSPAYRMIQNEFLMQLFDKGAIMVEELLEIGQFPNADKILQRVQDRRKQMEEQQSQVAAQQEQMAGPGMQQQTMPMQ